MTNPADPSANTATLTPAGNPSPGSASGDVGLVLLYADGFRDIPSVFVLASTTSFVGRQPPPNNLAIGQISVSRVHAQLTRKATGVKVTDLNSRNGTFVNGRRVTDATLQEGDVVRFGDAIFKLVTQAARYAPFRIDGTVDGVQPRLAEQVGGLKVSDIATEVTTIAPARVPVLIQGQTGVGKEGVARALHERSGRPGPFRAINCAAIPALLVESELFGHRKGAFTGATQEAPGLFRATDRGTLLLDEIGDMPLEAQAKLLRVLETREVVSVGDYKPSPVDVRIVAATHRDLRTLVDAGTFRADLYARLNGYTLRVPSLRERLEDMLGLVQHFLRLESSQQAVSFGFMYALLLHDWPFNIRELAAAIKRAVILSRGQRLEVIHLPEEVQTGFARRTASEPPTAAMAAVAPTAGPAKKEKRPDNDALHRLMQKERGNVAAVARALRRDRALVHRWLKDAGLDPDGYRSS